LEQLMCRFFKNKEQRAGQAKLKVWTHNKSDSKFATGDPKHTGIGNEPPKRNVVLNSTCPRCKSNRIVSAGYHDRVQCEKCGSVFSR